MKMKVLLMMVLVMMFIAGSALAMLRVHLEYEDVPNPSAAFPDVDLTLDSAGDHYTEKWTAGNNVPTRSSDAAVGDYSYAFDGSAGMAVRLLADASSVFSDDTYILMKSNFTIAFWMKSTNLTWNTVIMRDRATSDYRGIMLETTSTGNLRARFQNASSVVQSYDIPGVIDGTWHHVAITLDATDGMKWYKDGVLVKSSAVAGFSPEFLYRLPIGCNSAGSQRYIGNLDDVRIYDNALSQSEIQEMTGLIPGLHSRFEFDGTGVVPVDTLGTGTASMLAGNTNNPVPDSVVFKEGIGSWAFNWGGIAIDGIGKSDTDATIAFWIKASPSSGNFASVMFDTPDIYNIRGLAMQKDSSGPGLRVSAPRWQANGAYTVVPDVFDDQWHHIAMVCKNSNPTGQKDFYVYKDGLEVYSAEALTWYGVKAPLFIGNDNADGSRSKFIGNIDELRLYDIALDAGDIQNLAGVNGVPYDLMPNSGEDNPVSGILSWSCAETADSYMVFLTTDLAEVTAASDAGSPAYLGAITDLSIAYNIDYNTEYFWKVIAMYGTSPLSSGVVSFRTEVGPYPRLMAYEGWDYSTGVLATKGVGGLGWRKPWDSGDNYDYCQGLVGAGSLDTSVFDYAKPTTGNKIENTRSTSHNTFQWRILQRRLDYPVDLTKDQDYYFSFLVNPTGVGDPDGTIYGDGGLRAEFTLQSQNVTSVNYTNAFKIFGFGFTARYGSYNGTTGPEAGFESVTSPCFYVSDGDDTRVYSTKTWSPDTVYTIVAKLAASAAGNDILSVYAYASGPGSFDEPTIWDATIDLGQSDEVLPYVLIDPVYGDTFDRTEHDEVYVGTTWGSVTGSPEVCGDPLTGMGEDLNGDCYVNLEDLAVLASQWLDCTVPGQAGCVWSFDSPALDRGTPPGSGRYIYPTPQTITVDGDISDWGEPQWYDYLLPIAFGAAGDVTEAKVAFAWDPANSNYLYMAVRITDKNHTFVALPASYAVTDAIEIRFSANDTSTDDGYSTSGAARGDYTTAQNYAVSYDGSTGSTATLGNTAGALVETVPIPTLHGASVDGDDIIYELALPTYTYFAGIAGGSDTFKTMAVGEVIAFNFQINSLNGGTIGARFENQAHVPNNWYKYMIADNSGFTHGDWGYLDHDLDQNGEIGITELMTVALKWLDCTNPQDVNCTLVTP